LLYIENDKPDPVIEEMLPTLSHKQPKIIAATLSALTSIYHAYGCKTVEPKPVLKLLPKAYGHADKNVRAEAQNLTVELYRWLKDAMKPLFWGDLKPVQQQDLEKLFEKVKDEPPPRQERLLKSQQAIKESAAVDGGDGEDDGFEEEVVLDLEPELEAVNVLAKIPKDLQERLASAKWKDRKEALDDLHEAINHPRIEEGQFDDVIRSLAKCMKDANIAVVTIAANCIDILAKGLKRRFAKYRSTVMNPIMERLKEKKTSVTDALGAALDGVFSATSLSECLEEILEFLKNKNPQVKLESTKFLIRCLQTTRDPPSPPEAKSIAGAATKLLTESQENQRNAGAQVLGTLWKILGDKLMGPHLNDLDEIRKTKIKEYHDQAEVKAKVKPPKAAAPPKSVAQKRMGMVVKGKAGAGPKKQAPPSPVQEAPPQQLTPRLSSKPPSKLGAPKSGMAMPGAGLKPPGGMSGLQKRIPGPGGMASPVRRMASPDEEPAVAATPQPKLGFGRGGLTGRPLGKPSAPMNDYQAPPAISHQQSALNSAERAELEEHRADLERVKRENDMLRADKGRMSGQISEMTSQNAELIENHTRDVLSLKAKETQLVRARSDIDALEQQVESQRRDMERLKRELSRQVRASSPPPRDLLAGMIGGDGGDYNDTNGGAALRARRSYASSPKAGAAGSLGGGMEGKENLAPSEPSRFFSLCVDCRWLLETRKADDCVGMGGFASPRASRYLASPTSELPASYSSVSQFGGAAVAPASQAPAPTAAGAGTGAESWKRAAEVTQNLKARIEMMKVGKSFICISQILKLARQSKALERGRRIRVIHAVLFLDALYSFLPISFMVSCA
jgi:protein STU2